MERYLFYLLVFTVPFQIRKVLTVWVYPGAGGFNEWTAAFLYGTDLLVILLLGLGLGRSRTNWSRFWWRNFSPADKMLAIFLGVAALSLGLATNFYLGFYRWIKLLEWSLFFLYSTRAFGAVWSLPKVLVVIMYSGLGQALVAVGQALKQGSIGLSWLGESVLRTNFQGVATVPFEQGEFLRAYGTTPHPNILAAWLFLAVFAFYFWYLYPQGQRSWWLALPMYGVLLWGLLLTFSRVAIGLWFLGIATRFLVVVVRRHHYPLSKIFIRRLWILVIASVVILAVFASLYWPLVQSRLHIADHDLALTERMAYNRLAGAVVANHPWLGVGLGQFVWKMLGGAAVYPAYFYQPVHNIYLLIASELGLLGALSFALFIFYSSRGYILATSLRAVWQLSFFVLFISILIMGLFDHFLWTIQQGQLIFWMILAIANAKFLSKEKSNIIKLE